ncbi:MAG: 30S ribosomal protein S15 [Planctomycetota bacterium]|nr:MAG: 30S ribosomal protein S15 [Planctomycetota bacterium]
MALERQQIEEIRTQYRRHEKDTGSSELQIATLTADIRALTEHMKRHKKDFHSRRGLMRKVGIRNRLMRYLARKDAAAYKRIVAQLGIRG